MFFAYLCIRFKILILFCACGEIGRRARLRIWCLAMCRFESCQAHKLQEDFGPLFLSPFANVFVSAPPRSRVPPLLYTRTRGYWASRVHVSSVPSSATTRNKSLSDLKRSGMNCQTTPDTSPDDVRTSFSSPFW